MATGAACATARLQLVALDYRPCCPLHAFQHRQEGLRAARVWKYWQRLRGGVMPLRRLQVAELRHHRFPRIGQPHLHLSQGVVSFFGRESPGAPGSPSGASALARRRSAVLERTADRGRAPGACIASRQAPGRVATPSPGRAGPGAAPSRSGGRGVGRWRAGGHR
jgi:hypothetical protein